jgi:signal transduction histidine kinase
MPGPRWALIAEMSTTEAFQPVYKFAIHFFFILGIGILLILLISIFISRKLTEPLFHLSEASNAVAQGDLNIQITPKSQDEIGRLTQQFNQMVNSLKKSRQEAEISHRKLLQSEKLAVIGRLVASIVHEMRNPLSAIKMNLRIIERKTLPVELEAQHLQIASEQTKRLEKMLNELLEFSKPVIPNLITVNLQEIFQQVISGKKSLLETKKISLVTDFPASPVICKSDPDLLTRILDNVLLNAIQASDKNQCIFMKIVLAQNITVEIRDEGKGMSLKVQDRLFEPFFTTRENGVGLGMPNVKKFLDLLGGIIVVDSGENKGTRIIIKLPL